VKGTVHQRAQPALKHEGRSLRRTEVRHKIFRATDA